MQIGRLKIHPSFFVFLVMAAVLGRIGDFFWAFLAVSLHEMSHILAAKAYRLKIEGVLLTPIGETAYISGFDAVSANKKYAILLAGPLVNMALAAALWSFGYFSGFAAVNFSIGIFNMLPVYPLDGGRLLFVFSGNRRGILNAASITRKAAKAGIVFLAATGFFQLALFPFNISLLLIAAFFKRISEKESGGMIFSYYKCMLSKPSRLTSGGLAVKTAAFSSGAKVADVEKAFTWDCFHIIHVVDGGEISACFTETQIFEAATSLGKDALLRDVCVSYSERNITAESAAISPSPTAFDI